MRADDDPDPVLTQRFYGELRDIAGRLLSAERKDHTLQPTALVNEAFLRLATSSPLPEVPRPERLALAARVLRQVLVDHHRSRSAAKRGGGRVRVELDPERAGEAATLHDFEALHGALERLRALHPRQAEVVALRAFGGLSMDQVADALSVSKRTAEGDWTVARAWLSRELAELDPGAAR
jgi:RNA polymerase sigma factor (TIGR02999 family)